MNKENQQIINLKDNKNEFITNSNLGTTLLAILMLKQTKGYAKYKEILKSVVGRYIKNDSKIKYYLNLLSKNKYQIITEEAKYYFGGILIQEEAGIYEYDKANIIDMMIAIFKAESIEYIDKDYKKIFVSTEVRESIFNFLLNIALDQELWGGEYIDLYSLSDLATNFETHLIVMYHKEKLKAFPMLTRWAELIIDEENKKNLFEEVKNVN